MGYAWGRFQGCASIVFGILIGIYGHYGYLPVDDTEPRFGALLYLVVATLLIILGIGLLTRDRFGFVFFYCITLAWASAIFVQRLHFPTYVFLIFWWIIPGIFYYPKRRRDFGFGNQAAVSRQNELSPPTERSEIHAVRRRVGQILTISGAICYWVFGLLGVIVSLGIVSQVTGFWGFVLAFVFFPVTFVAAPWYALFHWGTWTPVLITYGGILLSWALRFIGGMLDPSGLDYFN